MKYVLRKDIALVLVTLGSADLIRWIAENDPEMKGEPIVEEDGRKFYCFNVVDKERGSVFSLKLPVTDAYFIATPGTSSES
jgi:hypothetical protein